MSERHLALFDIDGTITTRDTMFAFVRHAHGPVRTALGLVWLSPMLVLYRVGMIENHRAKQILLRHFFAGTERARLTAWAAEFAEAIDGWVRPEARDRLQWHRDEGHEVVLVSASLDVWMAPWAERQGLRLLCTRGEFDGERFTGGLASPNCHGAEKVNRVRAVLDPGEFAHVYAYGDSSGDREMLELAHEPHFRPFRGG